MYFRQVKRYTQTEGEDLPFGADKFIMPLATGKIIISRIFF
jgi:hypothetical protein